jgi:hypothetical protein
MVWGTNYFKLAAATMFTLFFGGKVFAPKCMVDGVNIQEYLQNHYMNAMKQIAKVIVEAGLDDDVVLGYDTLNEPSHGWIGTENITELPKEQELRKGVTPTPFETMLLGEGNEVENIDFWDVGSFGPQKIYTVTVDPDGVRAWLPDRKCIWADHGVWDPLSKQVLKPQYFKTHPKTGKVVDFISEFWKPFVNRFATELREIHPQCIVFVEPPVNSIPPAWTHDDIKGRLAYAPHWYDGLTLLNKKWNSTFNFDYIGFTRGRYASIAFAVKFGEKAIKSCFQSQLDTVRLEGEDYIGNFN